MAGLRALLYAFAVVLLFHRPALAAPPAPDCRARPAWCLQGYTCEPTSCTTRSTVALEGLGSAFVAARAERPRWFRPFVEGGLTWLPVEDRYGVYAEGGVILWRRVAISAEVTDEDARARIGWRREW